jgi:hypothetical protein
MAEKSLEQPVSVIEAQLAGKTLQEHFREQAELIDRLFAYRFEELDRKWGPRFAGVEGEVSTLKADVSALKADVSTVKKDMVIVREGIAILLKRRG